MIATKPIPRAVALIHRTVLRVVLGALCGGALLGCQSKPHRELYTDQLINEVRVLEDQLYEADYENKVLRSKLRRAVENCEQGDAAAVQPTPDPQADWGVSDVLPSPSSPQRPAEDAPGATLLPPPGGLPSSDQAGDLEERRIDVPGGRPREPQSPDLIPPDMDQLELPDIDMGEIVPPPAADAPPEPPMGQIPLPDMTPETLPEPAGLSINPTFSGGHNFDSDPEIDGVYLVVHFVDESGKVLDLSQVEIDASLGIEIFDPLAAEGDASGADEPVSAEPDNAEPADAASPPQSPGPRSLGYWEFDAQQIADMRRHAVQDGLHVAIRWSDAVPSGDHVRVQARVFNEDASLEGQAELALIGKGQIAGWVPRAGERKQSPAARR